MSTSANGARPSATLKRRLSTPLDNGSTPKRVKTEEEDVSMDYSGSENLRSGRRASPSGKDKRKRRHKKKKKLSIVKQEPKAASRVEPGPLGVSEKRVASSPPRSNATPGPSRADRLSTPAPHMNISANQDDESVRHLRFAYSTSSPYYICRHPPRIKEKGELYHLNTRLYSSTQRRSLHIARFLATSSPL